MRIARLSIKNFRGISSGVLMFETHGVLIGDNNTGKSTVFEAIDLVLGPDRLSRAAPIDEHDFYAGLYLSDKNELVDIEIEVVIADLNSEQERRFQGNLEYWNSSTKTFVEGPLGAIDSSDVGAALRVAFRGRYDPEEDDFRGETFFCHPLQEGGKQSAFSKNDKRVCGFLFLRTLRTGARALSLERGSLLDIILRVQDLRPRMWEDILLQLREMPVAADEKLGVSEILSGVQNAIRSFVPADWASDPHLRVSDLTREHLRKTLTVFMATGAEVQGVPHAAPFQHQGTGTINMLVLALLSMIAAAKQSVIFAMEEPEIAIPPATQKRIIDAVRTKAAQALFTSHSPYVLEEFSPSEIIVLCRGGDGSLSGTPVSFPNHIKPKFYSKEFRLGFAEALLARRVLIAEGETEAAAYPAAARRLNELDATTYSSFEALGIAVFTARTQSQIAPYGKLFRSLGKVTFAVFDKQDDAAQQAAIFEAIDHPFEISTKGFEDLLLAETAETALRRFGGELIASGEWPGHLSEVKPVPSMSLVELRGALKLYLRWSKGSAGAADLIGLCTLEEMPATVKATVSSIKKHATQPVELDAASSGAGVHQSNVVGSSLATE
jgi:putative ATP-dependent endonuclease of OLD family